MNYPLHLGVTEAGDGEDGRIKSAVGIGTLLEDGIGDTIRVSLTEEPEYEAPVAISLANRYKERINHKEILPVESSPIDPFVYTRRETFEVAGIGGGTVPKVLIDLSQAPIEDPAELKSIGYNYEPVTDKWYLNDQACDLIYLGKNELPFDAPNNLKVIYDYDKWLGLTDTTRGFPLLTLNDLKKKSKLSFIINFVRVSISDLFDETFSEIKNNPAIVFILTTDNLHGMAEQRRAFMKMILREIKNPVIIKREYTNVDEDHSRLYSSTDAGALLIDGLGDGVWLNALDKSGKLMDPGFINRTSFGILQATRTRISKTEYIACPSCGRTLFDLVEVTNIIRKRTEHLKGVKIAIMGCIVNGPGEMADADYGYVGSGPGKITLYRGKEIVKRSINSEHALDELIKLIQEDGKWVEIPQF